MKKLTYSLLIISSAFIFSACTASTPKSGADVDLVNQNAPQADQKSGDTTKSGQITTANDKYFLAEPGQTPKEIESYAVDLSKYVGQTVTVTGQYSGDTLFVGSVQ